MKKHFGDLTVTRGKEHRFLDMNIKINKERCIDIEMKTQLENCIDLFNEVDENKVVGNNVGLESNSESDNIDQNNRTVREKGRNISDVSSVIVHKVGTSCNHTQGDIHGGMTEHDATINIPLHRKSYADILRS